MIGKIISHYKIIEELGRGGMGVVCKAEETKLKRTVALKFLPPELKRDSEAKQRFIRKAQAASYLDHHNIELDYDIIMPYQLPGIMIIDDTCRGLIYQTPNKNHEITRSKSSF